MHVDTEFARYAQLPENLPPPASVGDLDALEREFWKKVTYSPPLYGADVEGSLFDAGASWAVPRLDTMLRRAARGPQAPRTAPQQARRSAS